MTTEELEELIQGAQESDSLEFKGAMGWEVGLIKDILAMANVQDGGRIVIGIEDETLERQGMTPEQLDSFIPDTMMDRVGVFADPHVSFSVDKVPDASGLYFVVITVAPFEKTPVICAKDGGARNELQAGALYYRSKTGRPKSARVSDANDMRDIIERAAIQTMRHFQNLGLEAKAVEAAAPPGPSALAAKMAEIFDKELGGL
ncbi:ATP-binding protein [Rhizobium sp. LC145]|uniref:AlbA family DNA-binding domain-containing protein n=1 Tax=Rhizobium sp. LC145 TaxID=1120688 RepID=UPI001FD9915F|nr:ATP-binding protein [Rhizobium sp. LC145]